MLRPGDVFRIVDTALIDPKTKRHVCICPTLRWSLRINTNPYWPPHHPIQAKLNPDLLDHDSYVELGQLCRLTRAEFAKAAKRPDNPIGRLAATQARELAWAAKRAPTLTGAQQDLIWALLVERWED